jgi:hypothetical protein
MFHMPTGHQPCASIDAEAGDTPFLKKKMPTGHSTAHAWPIRGKIKVLSTRLVALLHEATQMPMPYRFGAKCWESKCSAPICYAWTTPVPEVALLFCCRSSNLWANVCTLLLVLPSNKAAALDCWENTAAGSGLLRQQLARHYLYRRNGHDQEFWYNEESHGWISTSTSPHHTMDVFLSRASCCEDGNISMLVLLHGCAKGHNFQGSSTTWCCEQI